MKHVLPLTYEPKIKNVRNGVCRQTIRPVSVKKPKKVGDLVMFHGWSGKPYASPWSWRTDYFIITEVFTIKFQIKRNFEKAVFEGDILKDNNPMSEPDKEDLAVRDGFKDLQDMYSYFFFNYPELRDMLFKTIRWDKDASKKLVQRKFSVR